MEEQDKKTLDFNHYRAEKTKNEREEQVFDNSEKLRAHYEQAPHKFLKAWKKGIKLVGEEFFIIKSNTVDAATDEWQLAPNFEFIQKTSSGYSQGKQILLA